ncbi:MAG TPA: hypothetical protein VNQ77_20110 [Frankiaceae bacterium]|nr:hypothetical protein [Frankiaceae bacterium]
MLCAVRVDAASPVAARDRFAAVTRRAVDAVGRFLATSVTYPTVLGRSDDRDEHGNPLYPIQMDGSSWTDPERPVRMPFRIRLYCPRNVRGTFSITVGLLRGHEYWKDRARITLRCR